MNWFHVLFYLPHDLKALDAHFGDVIPSTAEYKENAATATLI